MTLKGTNVPAYKFPAVFSSELGRFLSKMLLKDLRVTTYFLIGRFLLDVQRMKTLAVSRPQRWVDQ